MKDLQHGKFFLGPVRTDTSTRIGASIDRAADPWGSRDNPASQGVSVGAVNNRRCNSLSLSAGEIADSCGATRGFSSSPLTGETPPSTP